MTSTDQRNMNDSFAASQQMPPDAFGQARTFGMGRPAQAGAQGAPAQGLPYVHMGNYANPEPSVADAQAYAQQVGYVGAAPQAGYVLDPEAYAAQLAAVQAAAASLAAGKQLQMPPEKKRRRWPIVLIILLVLLLAGAAAFFLVTGNVPGKSARSGTAGQLEGKTAEEIQAELDRVVDEGMFNISIASTVQFKDGTSPGELRIENVPGNRYLMRVVITLDDTGQQIYETDLIEPNFHIQEDTLDVDLDAGTYEATALFTAYDPESEEAIGQAAAKIAIVVDS